MNSSVPNSSVPFLSGPHQKFCEGILTGRTRADAYAAAYPSASAESARSRGSRLYRRPHIQAELARLRGKAEASAGSAMLSHVEQRAFLARVVRLRRGDAEEGRALGAEFRADGTCEGIRTRDKLTAIKLDAKLAGDSHPKREMDSELAAFHDLIREIRTTPWRPEDAGACEAGEPSSQACGTPAADRSVVEAARSPIAGQTREAAKVESAPSASPATSAIQSAAGVSSEADPPNGANPVAGKDDGSKGTVEQPVKPPDPPARQQTLQEFLDERHAAVMAGRPPGGDTPVPVPAWRRRGFRTASSGSADLCRIRPLPYILPQDQGKTPLYFFAEPGRTS